MAVSFEQQRSHNEKRRAVFDEDSGFLWKRRESPQHQREWERIVLELQRDGMGASEITQLLEVNREAVEKALNSKSL
jgi:hypothetical protein